MEGNSNRKKALQPWGSHTCNSAVFLLILVVVGKVPDTGKAFGAISNWVILLILFNLWKCHRLCWVFQVNIWRVDDTLSTWLGNCGGNHGHRVETDLILATWLFAKWQSWVTLCTASFLGSKLLDTYSLLFKVFRKGCKWSSQPFWHGFTPITKAIVELFQLEFFDC